MSATITAPRPTGGSKLSTGGVIRSEWIKLRSVRSTIWSYAIVIAVSVGMALLLSALTNFGDTTVPADQHSTILLQAATFGIYFGQLVVAVLGVLVISGEYSTGMIRSTLAAVPKRLPALAAKAFVLFATTVVVGLVASFLSLLIAVPILAGKGIDADFSDGSLIANVALSALYLGLVAVFSLGVGTVLRSSAGGIAAALGVILLLPTVLQVFAGITQAQWAVDVMPYLFSNAGLSIFTPSFDGSGPEQWQNLLIVLVWTAVSLAAGALLIKRRDA